MSQVTALEEDLPQSHCQKSDAGKGQQEHPTCTAKDLDEAIRQQVQRLHLSKPQLMEHIRMVTSLIEGRWVSLKEILQMLKEVLRQQRIGRKRRIDYIIQTLISKPP